MLNIAAVFVHCKFLLTKNSSRAKTTTERMSSSTSMHLVKTCSVNVKSTVFIRRCSKHRQVAKGTKEQFQITLAASTRTFEQAFLQNKSRWALHKKWRYAKVHLNHLTNGTREKEADCFSNLENCVADKMGKLPKELHPQLYRNNLRTRGGVTWQHLQRLKSLTLPSNRSMR